jgi:DNA polymerase III subunit delta'
MSWAHIKGHDHLIEGFRRVVALGRLAHAYLFSGPKGVGKHLFARELAKAYLCEAPENRLEACDHCAACALVDADTHPDLFALALLEDKNEITIESMKEFCASFSLKTARGHGKVAILEDADDLNEESANCFLKTLEEPPPRSVFILIGTSADRQKPTILSRCHVVRFGSVPDAAVVEILRQHGIEDKAQSERLARLAEGSPGQALALADPTLWQFRQKLLSGLAQPRIDLMDLMQSFTEFVEEAGKEAPRQRQRAALVIRLLVKSLTEALRQTLGSGQKLIDPGDRPILQALTNRASPDKILSLLERCLETEEQIDRYIQLPLVLEGLLDALVQLLEEGASPAASSGARTSR